MTHAEKVAWAEAMLLGPSNASTVFEWYQRISALNPVMLVLWHRERGFFQRGATRTKRRNDIDHNIIPEIGDIPVSDIQLADGAWIEGLM